MATMHLSRSRIVRKISRPIYQFGLAYHPVSLKGYGLIPRKSFVISPLVNTAMKVGDPIITWHSSIFQLAYMEGHATMFRRVAGFVKQLKERGLSTEIRSGGLSAALSRRSRWLTWQGISTKK